MTLTKTDFLSLHDLYGALNLVYSLQYLKKERTEAVTAMHAYLVQEGARKHRSMYGVAVICMYDTGICM